MKRLIMHARGLLLAAACLTPVQGHAGPLDGLVDRSQLYFSTSEAAAETCLAAPDITTDIRILKAELTKEKPRDLSSLRHASGVLQGLAHMSYGYEIQFTLERIRSEEGYCVRIAKMRVDAGKVAPTIWMKPGLTNGSCKYKVTMDHELQHVQNYHDHLARFERFLKRELPGLLEGRAYYRIASMSDLGVAEERLKAEAMEMVGRLHDESYVIAEAEDFAMDAPSEYRRLAQLCP